MYSRIVYVMTAAVGGVLYLFGFRLATHVSYCVLAPR
jgi:hypothetical protein